MLELTAFDRFVPVHVSGADAFAFMQGQLTTDLKKLSATQAALGAACSAQGRVQTLLVVLERPEGMILLLQSEFAEQTVARFRATTLSSKVNFEPAPLGIAAFLTGEVANAPVDLPLSQGACATLGSVTWLRFWGADERYLVVAPRTSFLARAEGGPELMSAWQRSDVLNGVPWIHAKTRGYFVPQTINLDLLGAVSFEKGCYIGQEVVARARRSGVPRRMLGFSANCSVPSPGTELLNDGAVVGEVVDATSTGSETRLLAAVDIDQAQSALSLREISNSRLTRVPLPYEVPLQRPAPRVMPGLAPAPSAPPRR